MSLDIIRSACNDATSGDLGLGLSSTQIAPVAGLDDRAHAPAMVDSKTLIRMMALLVQTVRALCRSRADLALENLALRQQLMTLKRKRNKCRWQQKRHYCPMGLYDKSSNEQDHMYGKHDVKFKILYSFSFHSSLR